MINTQNAEKIIHPHFDNLHTEVVSLEESIGKTLAEDLFSQRDLPPFDRVEMDGIAINSEFAHKFNSQLSFQIEDIQAAGTPQKTLRDNQFGCIEAMTGAILPKNTNMVIPYEQLDIKDNTAQVTSESKLKPYRNIHKQGKDIRSNEKILSKGQHISSPVVAILASEGITKVKVINHPQIAIVSTGSELVDLHKTPQQHQIYISNSHALKSELQSFGYAKINIMHIPDDELTLFNEMQDILNNHDLILLTGGVSKGKFDYVPQVLSDLKVNKVFHKVAQKPGKPLWFGIGPKQQVVFGLPGNPVSCLVNLRRHVVPNLIKERIIKVRLKKEIVFKKSMTLFQAATLEYDNGELWANPVIGNGSGDYLSLKKSNGFLELPAEYEKFHAGSTFPWYPWGKSFL